MSTFIGMFAVDQRRKRQLYTDYYSHVVVVFDAGLILVEAAPVRDYAVATTRRVPVPVPHAQLARTALRLVPKFAPLKRRIAQLEPLTLETLAASYPNRARRVWNDQIQSAVLKGNRRADLKIAYASDTYSSQMELWFTISLTEDPRQVRAALATMLGDRFSARRRSVLTAAGEAWSTAGTANDIGHDLAELSNGHRTGKELHGP
jgi:hypothetical protein